MSDHVSDLLNARCFVINMDRCPDRLETSINRIRDAGFKNIERFAAVDASQPGAKEDGWARHGNPPMYKEDDEFFTYMGKQGCMLSHLDLYKKIIDERIPIAVIFEDDVEFHKDWHRLVPSYWTSTPRDWDMIYLGCNIEGPVKHDIDITYVYCTHAYVVTLQGAERIYNYLLTVPTGVYTIDCMFLNHHRFYLLYNQPRHYIWYVWDAKRFLDERRQRDEKWACRNRGLVFQDADFGTFIRPLD